MITQPRVKRYAQEAAVRFDTSTRTIFTPSMSRKDVAARWWIWRRLRGEGFTYATIARWTGYDRSVVRKAISRAQNLGHSKSPDVATESTRA